MAATVKLQPLQGHLTLPSFDGVLDNGAVITIGRGAGADLSLPTFDVVSTRHAELTLTASGDAMVVTFMTAKNKMSVVRAGDASGAKQPISVGQTLLRDGDELRVVSAAEVVGGKISYRVRIKCHRPRVPLPDTAAAATAAGRKRARSEQPNGGSADNGGDVEGAHQQQGADDAEDPMAPQEGQVAARAADNAAAPDRLLADPGQLIITNRRFHDDYEEVALLASGAQGRVFKCRERQKDGKGKLFAVKYVPRHGDARTRDALNREIAILHSMRHPNIIRLYQVYNVPGEEFIYIVQVSESI